MLQTKFLDLQSFQRESIFHNARKLALRTWAIEGWTVSCFKLIPWQTSSCLGLLWLSRHNIRMGTGRSPGWQHAAPRSAPHYGWSPTFPTWLHTEAITRTHGKCGNFGVHSQLVEGKAQAPNTKSLNLSKAVLLHSDTFIRLNHPRHITMIHGKYTASYCILKHIIAYFKVKLNVFCTYLVPCSISISPVPWKTGAQTLWL